MERPTTTPRSPETAGERPFRKSAFMWNSIEAMRDTQEAEMDLLERGLDETNDAFEVRKTATAKQVVVDYLAASGVERGGRDFGRYYKLLRNSSIDRMDDTAWASGESIPAVNPDGTPKVDPTTGEQVYERTDSGRTKVAKAQVAMFGERLEGRDPREVDGVATTTATETSTTGTAEADDTEAAGTTEAEADTDTETDTTDTDTEAADAGTVVMTPEARAELDAAGREMDRLEEELAKLAAERQGKLFNVFNGKYNELKNQYDTQLAKLGKLELATTLNGTGTPEEKSATVVSWVVHRQANLREKTKINLKNTMVGKFVEFMNRGGFVRRFLKGAGLGVLAAGVFATGGALLAASAGIAAGAGAAGATVAGVGSRFARGFATADNKNVKLGKKNRTDDEPRPNTGRGMTDMSDNEKNALKNATLGARRDSGEAQLEDAVKYASGSFERDSKLENAKRRRSSKFGIVAVVAGGVLGTLGGEVAAGHGIFGWHPRSIFGWRPHWWNHGAGTQTPGGNTPPGPDTGDGSGNGNGGSNGGGNPNTGGNPHVDTTNGGKGFTDTGGNYHEWSSDVKNIDPNEGWLQSFKEIGLNVHDRYELLHNDQLMSKLANVKFPDGTPVAYRASDLGGWGINLGDGKMPQAALDEIGKFLSQHDYDLAR